MRTSKLLLIAWGTAAAQLAHAQGQLSASALQAACAGDAQRLCGEVQSGGGRIIACLKEHKASLSAPCRQAAGLPPGRGNDGAVSASSAPFAGRTPITKVAPAHASKASAPQGGDKFVDRVIADAEHKGMRAATIHVPEKWNVDSKIEWHYGWIEYPVSYSLHAENPASGDAYFQYPYLRLESTELPPQLKQYDLGRKYRPGERMPLGAIYMPPQPAFQALASFIKQVRANVGELKWIGQQDLPDLARALHLESRPNQHGVAIKIGYDLDGHAVEEAFFGVYYLAQTANAGVNAGMIKQINWGLQALQSFRAPAGTLDKQMPMFSVIAKSVYLNPKWSRLQKAITDQMQADFDQKLKQGYQQLQAAAAIRDETMKQQAAFQANFDKQESAFRASSGGQSATGNSVDDSYLRDDGARSASDHWSDLIRGVDTLNDPSTGGTTQLTNLGENHFTDGFGNYRTYDNSNDTPENNNESGTWTRMTEAR